jgi:hypothetical protein
MNMNRIFLKTGIITVSIALFFYNNSSTALAAPEQKKVDSVKFSVEKYRFKRKITIENQGELVSDAVIQVWFDSEEFDYSKTKANSTDIRFSTAPGNLTSSGLSYWTEQWNEDGITRIWVKVPVLKSGAQNTIYMYYGNSNAPVVSNGNTTFLFFDDFEDGNYSKKWNNVSIGEVAEQGGQLKLRETDGEDGIITANFDVTGKMIIRTLYQRGGGDEHWVRAGIGGWNKWFCFGDHTDVAATGTNYAMLFDSVSITSLKSVPMVKAANKVISDKWRRAAYWYDGSSLKGMQDDVSVQLSAPNASSKLALRTLDNDNWDNFAYITVSAYSGSEPIVTIGQQKNN